MHARTVLQKCFADVFMQMHAVRVQALVNAVTALLQCRRLVLMELARAWPGAERVRAPLKCLDRLLSNPHLQRERAALYAHMVRWLVRSPQPVIVVDWSTLNAEESLHLLRAALAVGGRTLTLYEEVHEQGRQQSPSVHRAFLRRLNRLLPTGCQPIIVSDAGFRCPWFREVEALGWSWIGRVRNHVCVKREANASWQLAATLYTGRADQVFGVVQLVRRQSLSCCLLRHRQTLKGRKHRTRRGGVSRSKASRAAARSQREPWLLAYSRSLRAYSARQIIQCYRQRMQIELSFRDLKSDHYGCAFEHSRTRKPARVAVLLLLHALASFLAWLQGVALTHRQQITHCAVRAGAKRAHYSVLRIGWESWRRHQPPTHLLPLSLGHLPTWLAVPLGVAI